MTPVQTLLDCSYDSAAEIARELGIPIEVVYEEFVHLEAMGVARVTIDFSGKGRRAIWEATNFQNGQGRSWNRSTV